MKITKKQLNVIVENLVKESLEEVDRLTTTKPSYGQQRLENLKSLLRTLENYETKVAPKLFDSNVYLRAFQKHIRQAILTLNGEITAAEQE